MQPKKAYATGDLVHIEVNKDARLEKPKTYNIWSISTIVGNKYTEVTIADGVSSWTSVNSNAIISKERLSGANMNSFRRLNG